MAASSEITETCLSLGKTIDIPDLPNDSYNSLSTKSWIVLPISPSNKSSMDDNKDKNISSACKANVSTKLTVTAPPSMSNRLTLDLNDLDLKENDNDNTEDASEPVPTPNKKIISTSCCGHDLHYDSLKEWEEQKQNINSSKFKKYKCPKCQESLREFVGKMAKQEYYDKKLYQEIRSPIYKSFTPTSVRMDIDKCLNGDFVSK